MTEWLARLPSTQLTIYVGQSLAVLFVIWALASDSFGKPLSDATLTALALFISGLVGAGVTQFGLKRKTEFANGKTHANGSGPSAGTSGPTGTLPT